MERSAMEVIADRLSAMDDLYFPRAFLEGVHDSNHRKAALLDLLIRDAPLFLERYGSSLTSEELKGFDVLGTDYEVGWHLKRIRSAREPTAEEVRVRVAAVKNRRRAHMERLVLAGEYFSEDAMREREPYLHHELVGRFQDPVGRAMSRPGERWSETLMRRCDEAALVEKIRGEQQRRGIARKDWVGGAEVEMEEEEEEDEEEEEEEEGKKEQEEKDGLSSSKEHIDGGSNVITAQSSGVESFEEALSEAELQYHLEQFTHIMQQKFLAGEDTEYWDYSKIDDDERLDDHWIKEANQDAEEKYFDED
ncbi:hypothetical protein DsansV1_C10g0104851 [Dioscorea sansibarensis]